MVTEIFEDTTKEVIHRELINEKVIESPKAIEDLGHDHKEQIDILQSIEDNFLEFQSKTYDLLTECPVCRAELKNYGSYASTYNSVFSDHKITLVRRRCTNKNCKRLLTFTIQGLFGDYRHPDLVEMQVETAASHSFVESQNIMDSKVKKHRPVNGQLNIKRVIERVGSVLHDVHQDVTCLDKFKTTPAKELIVQADGGYIKDKHLSRASFEALVSKIYSPDSIKHVKTKTGNIRGEITHKSYATSSYKDNHKTIKQMILVAAKKEGLTSDTNVVALADGAKNCWSVLKSLEKNCRSITYILDWWHIKRKFDVLIGQLESQFAEELESIKWKIWHGNSIDAITRLTQLYTLLITTSFADKAHDLLKYIINNKEYLVNYETRKLQGMVFTSSVMESGIESIVNSRFKKKKKAQWNQECRYP